ncbi:hypothetical protein AAHA92_28375 [Salvia divinorum]|uniref:Heat shock protein 70 n=1 Tax=Salvia divinorum TaxID=28513 RepID=A0ABD1FUV2_SALDI
MAENGEARAIGIDLGTTYSCAAVWQYGRVEIIPNDQGNRTTPSYVAFTRTERLVGDAAKHQLVLNPTNTVFDTASVLLEASVSIQTFQDQIKDMFYIISRDQTMMQAGEKRSDLRSRGLRLVPSVVLEELDRRFAPTPAVNLLAENH